MDQVEVRARLSLKDRQIRMEKVFEETARRVRREEWTRSKPTKRDRRGRSRQDWDQDRDCHCILDVRFNSLNMMEMCTKVKYLYQDESMKQPEDTHADRQETE